MSASTVVVA
ncbi:hypothetical protein HID58_053110 [Brassica napus]|uniref:Uncharacterized protein n=1 Tax=Brassica napus TaxID=3708 RepID=A0ABQ8ADT3_BRANA|nr:hypothetical protein HID58_053110 [Brassica napus]